MRGDFSRIRFSRGKNYTAVLEQQGRVALDADANEQCFIDEYQSRTETVDVVGEYGAPAGDAGFEITVTGNDDIRIGAGRYYVEGLLCENPASLSYESQPYLIDPAPAGNASLLIAELLRFKGQLVLQVVLQVWQRLVTALDDPCLREPALGRADTTTRLQTVWRVVATLAKAPEKQAGARGTSGMSACCQDMYAATPAASTGTMTAGTSGPSADCGCEPVAAAGYQGIENQLYRVEIHDGGDQTEATVKWSRENGSVVSAITGISGSTIQVSSLGPDANLGFQVGQWVELTDDTYLFSLRPNQPGMLYQIQSIKPADLSVTLAGPVTPVDPARHARMRRWDQSGPTATADGIPLAAGSPIQLENGIQVSFAAGTYQSGDYWTIPARTASGQIDWPPCGSDGNAFQPPTSIQVYNAPLACVHWVGATKITRSRLRIDDCRRKFSPLTALTAPATGQAIHVQDVNWVNDEVTTLDQLVASGLTITLDQAPSGPVNGANFVVTFEPATGLAGNEQRELISFVPGFLNELLPTTILRGITIVDAEIVTKGQTVSWLLPFDQAARLQQLTIDFLDALISLGAGVGWFARVRIRLLGQMIFATGAAGPLYLDGRAFGQPALRRDGVTPRIGLQLPSGQDAVASDFDGWFYVAPTLQVVLLTVTYPNLTVVAGPGNNVTGVVVTGSKPPEDVTPTAVVRVNYPAIADATIALALVGEQGGVGNVASIQSTVPIASGETSATVPITIVGNPGSGQTLNFTITATLGAAAGPASGASGTFTVTGAEPTQPPAQ